MPVRCLALPPPQRMEGQQLCQLTLPRALHAPWVSDCARTLGWRSWGLRPTTMRSSRWTRTPALPQVQRRAHRQWGDAQPTASYVRSGSGRGCGTPVVSLVGWWQNWVCQHAARLAPAGSGTDEPHPCSALLGLCGISLLLSWPRPAEPDVPMLPSHKHKMLTPNALDGRQSPNEAPGQGPGR